MRSRLAFIALLLVASVALAADISGTWTASFETQIGTQTYTYVFKVTGNTFAGTAKSNLGSGIITGGKINGDDVSFVETLDYQGQQLQIPYKGKIAGDEMKLTRSVMEMAEEQLTAKRAK